MKTWYNIKVLPKNNATSEAEISIFDEIGYFGVDASAFKADFDKVKNLSSIKLLINSPGGSVFDGIAIYNMLSDVRDKLTVEVEGLAASIASVIALAGSKTVMREGTFMMVHNPWTMMIGDADELRQEADVLDKIKSQLVSIYESNSNLDAASIESLMKEETWLSGTEAKAMGLVDEVVDAPRMAASFNKTLAEYGFNKMPVSEISKNLSEKPESLTLTGEDLQAYLEQKKPVVDLVNEDTTTVSNDAVKADINKRILRLKIENLVK